MTAPDRDPCLVPDCLGRADFYGLCDWHSQQFNEWMGSRDDYARARREWLDSKRPLFPAPRPRCEVWHHVLAVAVGVATGVTALALVAAVMAAGGGM